MTKQPKRRKVRKVRKPRPWPLWKGHKRCAYVDYLYGGRQVTVSGPNGHAFLGLDAHDCRRLSAWLIRAAQYLEQEERRDRD